MVSGGEKRVKCTCFKENRLGVRLNKERKKKMNSGAINTMKNKPKGE